MAYAVHLADRWYYRNFWFDIALRTLAASVSQTAKRWIFVLCNRYRYISIDASNMGDMECAVFIVAVINDIFPSS